MIQNIIKIFLILFVSCAYIAAEEVCVVHNVEHENVNKVCKSPLEKYETIFTCILACAFAFVYKIHEAYMLTKLAKKRKPNYFEITVVDSLWHSIFCGGSIIFCLYELLPAITVQNILELFKPDSNVWNQPLKELDQEKFVALFGYYLLQTYRSGQKEYDVDFWDNVFFCLFLHIAQYLRFSSVLLYAVLTINICLAWIYISKISFSLYKTNSKKRILKIITYYSLIFHAIGWIVVFGYIWPFCLLYGGFNVRVPTHQLITLFFLNICMYVYFLRHLRHSVVANLIYTYFYGWGNALERKRVIECSLFPEFNDITDEIKRIKDTEKLETDKIKATVINQADNLSATLFQSLR